MKRLRSWRPTPSLVISVVALFVAMGGTGYAAIHLGKNTVGAAQIRTGAVGSPEVKNKSLKTVDLSTATVKSLRGKAGPQGQPGANGTNGTNGAPGPSDSWVASLSSGQASFTLPPGSYVLGGGATVSGTSTAATLHCIWAPGLPPEDTSSQVNIPGQDDKSVTTSGAAAVSTPGGITVTRPSNFTMTLSCTAGSETVIGAGTVTKVGTLH